MKKLPIVAITVLLLSGLSTISASAGSICNNGSYSSNSGRGTCSYNGGVNKSMPSFSDPGSSSYNRNNGFGSSSSLNNSFGKPKKCPKYSFC